MNRVKMGSGWEHLLEIAKLEGVNTAYTWSPAAGCHGLGCILHEKNVCWAEKISKRFHLDFHPHPIFKNFKEPLKCRHRSVITPVPRGDLFGQSHKTIETILRIIDKANHHIFALLTKLPQIALKYNPYSNHVWFGVTVNSQADVWRLEILKRIDAKKKYVMFEPLYSAINYDISWVDLAVIGAQTNPLIQPKREWVESIEKSGAKRIFYKTKVRLKLG